MTSPNVKSDLDMYSTHSGKNQSRARQCQLKISNQLNYVFIVMDIVCAEAISFLIIIPMACSKKQRNIVD